MPPKIRPSPQLSSDVIIEKKTTKATAPRGVRGTFASFLISLCTGGDVATTNPPMIIIAICIVNGISPQNPSPKYLIRFRVPTPANNPATKTMINPTRANTNASGNHFWDQSASPIPKRANTPAESSPASCVAFRFGIDSMRPFQIGQIATPDGPVRRQSVAPASRRRFCAEWKSEKLPARRRRYVSTRASTQLVSAGTSLLMSERFSSDFTEAMTDSAFAVGHFANSAQPLNLSATSS